MEKQSTHVTDGRNRLDTHVAQCRTAYMAGILMQYLKDLMDHGSLPPALNRNVLRQSQGQIERCIRELRRTVPPHENCYLDRTLHRPKLLDIAVLIDVCSRIGLEEPENAYDEFFGLLVDCIDAVFYAQQNRRKMHFPKYRALFNLLQAEIKRDVNDQPAQIVYDNKSKELFFRTAPVPQQPQLR